MSPTLHHAAGTRSIRVLWTLEEIGAAYDVATTLFPPRTRAPEYLEVNPTGTIPAFVDEDIRLTESMAICQVLAERHGRQKVMWRMVAVMGAGLALTLAQPLWLIIAGVPR